MPFCALSFCLACKVTSEDRVFAVDACHFTQRYDAADLSELEGLAFMVLLPNIGHIHERAFMFRTSLLDLVIDSANAPERTHPSRNHVLIVEDGFLQSVHADLVRDAAPNVTIHFAASRWAAQSLVDTQAAAGSPMHLVLLGEICSSDARELEALVRIHS